MVPIDPDTCSELRDEGQQRVPQHSSLGWDLPREVNIEGSTCWSPRLLLFLILSLLLLLGTPEAPLQLGANIISKWHILLNPAEIKAPDTSINRGIASKPQQFVASCQNRQLPVLSPRQDLLESSNIKLCFHRSR